MCTRFVYFSIQFPRLTREIYPMAGGVSLTLAKGSNIFMTDSEEIAKDIYSLFYCNGGPCKSIISIPEDTKYNEIHQKLKYKYSSTCDSSGVPNKVSSKWTKRS